MGFESYQRKLEPLTDDFKDSVTIIGTVNDGVLSSQNLSSVDANKEYQWYIDTTVKFIVGGTIVDTGYTPTAGVLELSIVGGYYTLELDSSVVASGTFTRGTASEPTATYTVGAGHNGTLTAYSGFYTGQLINKKLTILESPRPSDRYIRKWNGVNTYADFPPVYVDSEDLTVDVTCKMTANNLVLLSGDNNNADTIVIDRSGFSIRAFYYKNSVVSNILSGTVSSFTGEYLTIKLEYIHATTTANLYVNNELLDTDNWLLDSALINIAQAGHRPNSTYYDENITGTRIWLSGVLERDYKFNEQNPNDPLLDYSGNNQHGTYYQFDSDDISYAPTLNANWPIDDNSQYCADSNGGASLEIQQYDANNWELIDA